MNISRIVTLALVIVAGWFLVTKFVMPRIGSKGE